MVTENPWGRLRALTPARIALGRAGHAIPTRELLAFRLAHARARDAVHASLDVSAIVAKPIPGRTQPIPDSTNPSHTPNEPNRNANEPNRDPNQPHDEFDQPTPDLNQPTPDRTKPSRDRQGADPRNSPPLLLHSEAPDRLTYLRRPDLGRRLDQPSQSSLARSEYDLVFVIADGLSALAVHRHAAPLLDAIWPKLADWKIAPICIVEQGRVAIGDEIGERLGATLVAVLIGERPGLSAPDSLGIYVTHAPHTGVTDAQRNCISNVRDRGLSYEVAAERLYFLLSEARRRKLSGIALKEERRAVLS